MSIIRDNPVFRRELRLCLRLRRSRMGSGSSLLWVGSLLLCLIAFFYARGLILLSHGTEHDAQDIWSAVMYGLLFAAVLLAPVLTATSISQEREQQTWEMLAVTRLTPTQVVLGKWLARLAPLALLAAGVAPLLLASALHGQVSLVMTAWMMLFIAAVAGIFGGFGLLCSFIWLKSAAATVGALTLCALVCFLPLMLASVGSGQADSLLTCINPFYALLSFSSLFTHQRIGAFGGADNDTGGVLVFLVVFGFALRGCLAFIVGRYYSALGSR